MGPNITKNIFLHVFAFLCGFAFFFLYFLRLVMEKFDKHKKLISTSKSHEEHLFAGRNTQRQLFMLFYTQPELMYLNQNHSHLHASTPPPPYTSSVHHCFTFCCKITKSSLYCFHLRLLTTIICCSNFASQIGSKNIAYQIYCLI